jgi:hypothetical protein
MAIRPDEIAEGQRRVIVNLDSLEYLDPVKFGQVPTLAGMLADRGPPPLASAGAGSWPKLFEKADPGGVSCIDVAGALFAMLCHPRRRGGGDLPANAGEMTSIDAQRAEYAKLFSKGADKIKGRWRGGHILGTSEIHYEDWPATEEVIERGKDISDAAIRYLVAVSHY